MSGYLIEDRAAEVDLQDAIVREYYIKALQKVQSDYPDKNISRDFFVEICEDSKISERKYKKLWGNFTTFKMAAGLASTKSENKYYSNIAKHATVQDLKDFNRVKNEWNKSFRRDSEKKEQVFLVGSDIHDLYCDPFYRRMFIEAAKITNPTKIIFNGDLFDNPEFSKYTNRPSDYRVEERLHWVHSFWSDLRNIVPDAEFNLVEGNHEVRLVKSLIEKSPGMMSILDYRGFDIKSVLGFNDYEVNYFSSADLATFTNADMQNEQNKNFYVFKEHLLCHHFPVGESFGLPGISGHHHYFKATPKFSYQYGSYAWYQSGAGTRHHVDYQITQGIKWNNGFFIVRVDINDCKNTIFEYVDTTRNKAIIQGQYFYRKDDELLFYSK